MKAFKPTTFLSIFVSVLFLFGCAGSPSQKMEKALHGVNTTLALVDEVSSSSATAWASFVEERVSYCEEQDLKTVQEKKDCLGLAMKAEDMEEAYQSLVLYQQQLSSIVLGLSKMIDRVGPVFDELEEQR